MTETPEQKLTYANHMLLAVSNQRNNAQNECVHFEAKLALANAKIAALEVELKAARAEESAAPIHHVANGALITNG